MMDLIYDLSFTASLFFMLAVIYTLAVIAALLLKTLHRRRLVRADLGLSPGILTSLSLPTGLVAVFMANGVWQDTNTAQAAVDTQAQAVRSITRLTDRIGEPARPVRTALLQYVESMSTDAWASISKEQRSDKTEDALQTLRRAAFGTEKSRGMHPATWDELQKQMIKLEDAHENILQISRRKIDPPKWFALIAMVFVLFCAIAEVHAADPRAKILALFLNSTSFGLVMFLILVYDRPLTGETAIRPVGLTESIAELRAPPR